MSGSPSSSMRKRPSNQRGTRVAAMFRAFFCLGLIWPTAGAAEEYIGSAEVIDGDSLHVAGVSIRLFGIDAPESKQTCDRGGAIWRCGEEAARQLQTMIGGNPVQCRVRGTDPYNRTVAVCTVAGVELNRAMVEAGWATAFRKYAQDYVNAETRAKAARRGIWDSGFEMPEIFRSAQAPHDEQRPAGPGRVSPVVRQPTAALSTPSGCVIKGNRNRQGQWIYHLPGMPAYDATRPEELFCTEAQARAAGYRRAIVRR